MEYALLAEHERLEGIAEIDGRYHLAKLVSNGFAEPERIWEEHQRWRSSLTAPAPTPEPAMSRDQHMALALDIERRLRAAGVIQH